MFKKTDSAHRDGAPRYRPNAPESTSGISKQAATPIGPSMHIDGDVRGNEDLVVHGRVHGSIDIGEGRLIVTRDGRIDADVRARIINVEGHVVGDLHATEQIIVRKSGRVRGNATAPRVALDFGCEFSGAIDCGAHKSDDNNKPSATRDQNIADFKAAISVTGDPSARSTRSATAKRSP